MRRGVLLRFSTAAAAVATEGVFKKQKVPKDPNAMLGHASPKEAVLTSMFLGSRFLLKLLKEREFLRSSKYDFNHIDFLVGAQQAYKAVAEGIQDVPTSGWSGLTDVLPSDLCAALQGYVETPSHDEQRLPLTSDVFLSKIMDVRFTMDPPKNFPNAHHLPSLTALLFASAFNAKGLKTQWNAYLQQCAEWYQQNVISIDVLFLIVANPKRLALEDLYNQSKGILDVQNTHLWTFQRDHQGEWNILEMDH